MNNLGNVKIFGGIGALLLLIGGFIPYAGPIVSIIGLVLVFIAVKSISELTKDNDIFRNYLIHFIMSIFYKGKPCYVLRISCTCMPRFGACFPGDRLNYPNKHRRGFGQSARSGLPSAISPGLESLACYFPLDAT